MAMDVKFGKDELNYYQSLTITVNAPVKEVVSYFDTTEGLSQWFPQLSYKKVDEDIFISFDKGNGESMDMKVLELHLGHSILFEWGGGEVKIELNVLNENQTYLTIDEMLPATFPDIAKDFTGWQYQLINIKHIAETGQIKPKEQINFEAAEEKTAQDLGLL